MSNDTFYITTPIYYPNDKPHMGHIYTTTFADIIARYHRQIGVDTYFLTGLDENSEKVKKSAEKSGEKLENYLDKIATEYKAVFSKMDISYNQFIRTTDKDKHWPGAIKMWDLLDKSGDIYKSDYEGLYCVGCESFMTDKELKNGKCPLHNEKPEKIKEENYFFKLSKYAKQVKAAIENGDINILPEKRKKEVLSFLSTGLEDVSFSRPKAKVPWGIPVPNDKNQVMYVWADALTNYISALGFGRDDDHNFKHFWPANYHLIGKEISRFHSVIWPAMLLSANLPLPKNLFAHGFILSGGKKMSKTMGNVIDPVSLIDKYGCESLRYYIARHINPFEDSDMTEKGFNSSYNAHLANGIGNLASRILTMVEQYDIDITELMLDPPMEVLKDEEISDYHKAFDNLDINKAIDFVWSLIAFMDSYIQDEKPFKTIDEDEEKAQRDIMLMVEKLWVVGVLLEPFMPTTAEKIRNAIRAGKAPETLFPRVK